MRKLLLLAVFVCSISAWGQPPPDCARGFCAGMGSPMSPHIPCKAGNKYTQLDSPGTSWSCTGVPPDWVLDMGSSGIFIDRGSRVYDVRAYGAKVDGSTNDTTAITSAVSAASTAGGGVVFIPAGVMIAQPIQGVSNVIFKGAGTAQTTWKLIASATPVAPSGSGTCSTTASVVIECFTSGWGISNLTIDGNQANQSATTSHGIYVSAVGYGPTTKSQPSISGVTVQFTESDGIHIDPSSNDQGVHSNITVYSANGIGIYAGSFDTQWININVGQSGLAGIQVPSSSQHFTSVKSWFSGRVTPSSGNGFVAQTGAIQCDSCEMQDNQADGLLLSGASGNVFTGLVSTGNNRTSVTTGVGVDIVNSSQNVIVGNAQGGIDFPASQLYALSFSGTSANNTVRLTSATNVTGLISGTFTSQDVLVLDATGAFSGNTLGGRGTFSGNGALSVPAMLFSGTPVTSGGSASTMWPMVLIEPSGATNATWALAGTMFGINATAAFTGNLFDFQFNGVSELALSRGGTLTGSAARFNSFGSTSNCSSAASPAVCGGISAGSVVIAAAATSIVVNTTAVTANSQILVQQDAGLGTKLSVTCNTTLSPPQVTARTAGTSFTISTAVAPTTNPACYSYAIIN